MPLVTNSAHLIAPFVAVFEITEKAMPGVEALLAVCSIDTFPLLCSSTATLAGKDRAFHFLNLSGWIFLLLSCLF